MLRIPENFIFIKGQMRKVALLKNGWQCLYYGLWEPKSRGSLKEENIRNQYKSRKQWLYFATFKLLL